MNAPAHIRKRYPKNTGNSRYKDRRTFDGPEYEIWTFCGAPITDRDLSWAQRNTKHVRSGGTAEFPVCTDCVAKIIETEGGAS